MNKLIVTYFSNYHYARVISMYVYRDDYWNEVKSGSQKLFLESYFDLSSATLIGLVGLAECKNTKDFIGFFHGFSNILNSVLTMFLIVALVCFLFYSFFLITSHYKKLANPLIA